MRLGQLARQVALWGMCVLGLNSAVGLLARRSIPRQVAARIDQSSPITDLFVGNSLMQAGLDSAAFEHAGPARRTLNIALGASSPIEHDVLLRRARNLNARCVYYGFFDTQLVVPMPDGWGDLVGNRAMAYYLDPATSIRFYAAANPLRAILMRLAAQVPLFVERTTLWARVEHVRRCLGGFGLPGRATNQFGRAEDFRLLEQADPAEFRRACCAVVAEGRGVVPAVADMLQFLRDRKVPLICVEMPMTADHRRRFYDNPDWRQLRDHIAEQIRREGGVYLVASDWIDDHGFADNLHLNERGASEFSARLATVALSDSQPSPRSGGQSPTTKGSQR